MSEHITNGNCKFLRLKETLQKWSITAYYIQSIKYLYGNVNCV